MRTLSQLTLLAAATAALHATEFTDVHPSGYSTNKTYAYGVSPDGLTLVGSSNILSNLGSACSFDAAGWHDLGLGAGSYAMGIAANGTIVGTKSVGGIDQAFKLFGSTTTLLGDFGYGTSNALAISHDGTTIVGHSFDTVAEVAFKWTSLGGMVALTPTPTNAYQDSKATGVSQNGGVIVGWMTDSSGGIQAFRYVGSSIANVIDGGGSYTKAFAVSGDGLVTVGQFDDGLGYEYAFKHTVSGGLVSLGSLGGYTSEANAASFNGSVIVGKSLTSSSKYEAFVYQTGTMTGLGFLGTGDESNATGVSADGTVIVGYSRITAGGAVRHAFVYTNVMLDETEWMRSLNGPGSLLAMTASLTQQPLEGAHHRPLMSYDSMGKQTQAWATGDFGTSSRQSDRHMTSGEIGVSQTYGDFVLGIAAGHASLNQDLLFGGNASISGNYLLAEADYRLADKESIASLVLMQGDYDATASRGYLLGGGVLDASRGSTGLKTSSARLRLDGPAQKFVSAISATPFVSYTVTRTTADAYTETGGSFPASFAAQEHTAQEGRLGVTAKYVASPSTTLLFTAEWIHRFDDAGDGLSGVNLATSSAFAVGGIAPTANQARFGFDIDHKLSADTLLNFSVHAAGTGPTSDVSAALSVRRAF